MSDADVKARARAIVEKAVNGVLITMDNDGFPHPLTMWTAQLGEDFTVYLVTGRSLVKCRQIEGNPRVCMFWTLAEGGSVGWSYALIKGMATITDDQSLRDRFWNKELEPYFPSGKSDPEYVVIAIKPKTLMLMDSHKYPLDRVEF